MLTVSSSASSLSSSYLLQIVSNVLGDWFLHSLCWRGFVGTARCVSSLWKGRRSSDDAGKRKGVLWLCSAPSVKLSVRLMYQRVFIKKWIQNLTTTISARSFREQIKALVSVLHPIMIIVSLICIMWLAVSQYLFASWQVRNARVLFWNASPLRVLRLLSRIPALSR